MDLCCLQSPHPSVLLGPLKERGGETGKEIEKGREPGPVAFGRLLGVHKAPRTAHIPVLQPLKSHTPLPQKPLLFSLSLFFLFLCLLAL